MSSDCALGLGGTAQFGKHARGHDHSCTAATNNRRSGKGHVELLGDWSGLCQDAVGFLLRGDGRKWLGLHFRIGFEFCFYHILN